MFKRILYYNENALYLCFRTISNFCSTNRQDSQISRCVDGILIDDPTIITLLAVQMIQLIRVNYELTFTLLFEVLVVNNKSYSRSQL